MARQSNEKDRYGYKSPPRLGSSQTAFTLGMVPKRTRAPGYRRGARLVVWGGIGLLVAGVTATLVLGYRQNEEAEKYRDMNTVLYNPSFKVRYADMGREIVQSWYAGKPKMIDTAHNVNWPESSSSQSTQTAQPGATTQSTTSSSGVTPLSNVAFVSGYQAPLPIKVDQKVPNASAYTDTHEEVLTYYAIQNGQPMNVTIQLAVPNRDGSTAQPVLMAPPSIAPAQSRGTVQLEGDPESAGMQKIQSLSPAATQQVTNWARAWTANDSQALKQITQDPSGGAYFGLGSGWALSTQQVSPRWQYTKPVEGKSYVLAEVEFDIARQQQQQDGSSQSSSTSSSQSQNKQVMDVMVGNYDSGLPTIVAWGPAGSWATMRPYQNAGSPPPAQGSQSSPSQSSTSSTQPSQTSSPQPAPQPGHP